MTYSPRSPRRLFSFVCVAVSSLTLLASAAETQPKPGQPQQLTSPDQTPQGLAKSDWASIKEAHAAWEHGFMPVEGGWQARNPGQQWTTKFDGRGFTAQAQGATWQWGLELRSYGFSGSMRSVGGQPEVQAQGQRLSYQWDADVQEWFVNDQRGLEHGFTLRQRPAGAAPGSELDVVLGTRGTLKATVAADAQTVHFRDAQSAPVVTYAGLKVWDADGKVVPSRFVAGQGGTMILRVSEPEARYPLTIDPIAQQAYVKPLSESVGVLNANDQFGRSVAVDGDTVVVGANYESSNSTGINSTPNESALNSGAAYVFTRSGGVWSQQAYLKAHQVTAYDNFGYSVAVSGDTVVVGANYEASSSTGINSTPNESATNAGAAYVFTRSGTVWSQQAYLKAHQVTASDQFGISVAVSGDTVVVGSPNEDSSSTGINSTPDESASAAGAAYVFTRTAGVWSQQAYLKAHQVTTNDSFGTSVTVSGDTVVVGAVGEASSSTGINSTPNESAAYAGAAYVFTRSGGVWSQQAYLKAHQVTASDQFGRSVAVDGDTVVVGATGEDSSSTGINSTPNESATNAGAAYVFTRTAGVWSQQAYLKAHQVNASDWFGYSVAVDEDTVVVGAPIESSSSTGVNSTPNESATIAGAAYVFTRSGGIWSQQAYLKAHQVTASDQFGTAVAVSADTVVVGAPYEDSSSTGINSTPNESAGNAGAGYVFTRSGGVWSQQAYVKASSESVGVLNAYDSFGRSVAVSGDTVVVGAPFESSSSTGINSTPNESASTAGAAYVFTRSAGVWSQQAYLKAHQVTSDDRFGTSVAVSGDTVVVGSILEDSSGTGINTTPNESAQATGAAYVFTRSGGVWSQQAFLKAHQVTAYDQFGWSVAVNGDTAVVSSCYEDSSSTGVNSTPNEAATSAGAAYVFTRTAGVWSQQAYLKAHQVSANDLFGASVAVSGDTVVVGAYGEASSSTGINSTPNESAGYSGAAYVFTRSGTVWSQQAYLKAHQVNTNDNFGYSVAVSGDTVVAGAIGEDSSTTGVNSLVNEATSNAGAAYVFTRNAGVWSQQAYLKAHQVTINDYFGFSVGVSGDTVVVGAYCEDSSSTGINSTPNESSEDSGAVYIFSGLGPVIPVPTVTNVSPAIGTTAGSTSVTITGTNFTGATAVSFGGTAATTVVVDSATQITATTPAHAAGAVSVLVTTPGGTNEANTLYTYRPPAEISVSGNGQEIVSGSTSTSAANHTDFGSVMVAGGTVTRTFSILNTGGEVLNLTGTPRITLSGDADQFTISQPSMSVLPATTGATSFSITFDPSSIGDKTATVSIPNNDADENPYTFAIKGTGLVPQPGVLDATFDTDGRVTTVVSAPGEGAEAQTVQVQPDGKILVGGFAVTAASNPADFFVIRYNADGTLDTTWDMDGAGGAAGGIVTTDFAGGNDFIYDLKLQPDGKVVVVGSTGSPVPQIALARYNSDGTLDTTFGTGGKVQTYLPGGSMCLARSLVLQPDGKIVVAGIFGSDGVVLRYNANGSLDQTFGTFGVATDGFAVNCEYVKVVLQPDTGRILLAGTAILNGLNRDIVIDAFTSTGVKDTSFGTNGDGSIVLDPAGLNDFGRDIAVLPDGRFRVLGTVNDGSQVDVYVLGFTKDGAQDDSFSYNTPGGTVIDYTGGGHDEGMGIAIRSDGAIAVCGWAGLGVNSGFAVAVLKADGTPDDIFDGEAWTQVNFAGDSRMANAVAWDTAHNIVAVGSTNIGGNKHIAVARLFGPEFLNSEIAVFDGNGTTGAERTDNVGTHAFGGVIEGSSSAAQTFTIQNTGEGFMTGLAVTPSGTNAAEFTLGSLSATALAPGASATFTVTFSPTSAGAKSATISIASNDPDENPFRIKVSGTGVALAPELAVYDGPVMSGFDLAPTNAIIFSNVGIGSSGSPRTFTIENAGTAPLTGLALSKSGGGQSSFTVGTLSATTLAPSETATFTVTFSPQTLGLKEAVISIASNDADENPFNLNVSGTGTVPAAIITKITPNSGPTAGGTAVTLIGANFTGTSSVTIGGSAATNVVVRNDKVLTAVVPAHSAGAVDVVVTTPGGPVTGAGLFTYIAPPTPLWTEQFETGLSSTLPGPNHASPGATLSLATGSWYALNASTPVGSTGVFGGQTEVFSPAANGQTSFAMMNYNSTGNVGTINTFLMTPVLTLNNGDTLTFITRTYTGQYPDRMRVVMSQNGASTTPSDFSTVLLTINPNLTTTGYPNTWTSYTVTVSGLTGPISGRLAFNYNVASGGLSGGNSDFIGIDVVTYTPGVPTPEISIQGNGLNIADGDESPRLEDHTDFGPAVIAAGNVERTFTIANTGPSALNLSEAPDELVTLTGDTDVFSVTAEPASTVSATNGTTTFKITFSPNALGVKTATVTVVSDDADEGYYTFAIKGTGIDPAPAPVPSLLGEDVVTNGAAPGADGSSEVGKFDLLRRGGFLAENGYLVFPGYLEIGSGSPAVTVENNSGLWKTAGSNLFMLSRTGTTVPDVAGAQFATLPEVPGISDEGEVTFLGTLTVGLGGVTTPNDTGVWSELGGTGLAVLLRENDIVPGVTPEVRVDKFASGVYATATTGADSGEAAFSVTYKGGSTKTALLRASVDADTTTVSVIAQEGELAPGTTVSFSNLAGSYSDPGRMDAQGNFVFSALTTPGSKEGIWYQPVTGGAPTKVVFAGDAALGTTGTTFSKIYRPSMGSSGYITFRATVSTTGDNAGNLRNDGIWAGQANTPSSITSILRRGDGQSVVSNLPTGAKVGNVWGGWVTNNNRGAWRAWLDVDGNGTSAAPTDKNAIYANLSGSMRLVLTAGDAAPGTTGATFQGFDLPVVGGLEQYAFIGTLTGGDVVGTTNNEGLWISDENGGALNLVLRKGDTMETTEGEKTIEKIDLPGSTQTDRRWEQQVMDGDGRMVIFVKFTDGSSSQILTNETISAGPPPDRD